MTSDAIKLAVCIGVLEYVSLDSMAVLAILLHLRITDVGHPSGTFDLSLIVAGETADAMFSMNAHEMLRCLIVVIGFSKIAKFFFRKFLRFSFRIDAERLKKAVDAFDLERYILKRFRYWDRHVVLRRCDRTETKASEYGKNDGSFDIQHF